MNSISVVSEGSHHLHLDIYMWEQDKDMTREKAASRLQAWRISKGHIKSIIIKSKIYFSLNMMCSRQIGLVSEFVMSSCTLTNPCSKWPEWDLFQLLMKSPIMIMKRSCFFVPHHQILCGIISSSEWNKGWVIMNINTYKVVLLEKVLKANSVSSPWCHVPCRGLFVRAAHVHMTKSERVSIYVTEWIYYRGSWVVTHQTVGLWVTATKHRRDKQQTGSDSRPVMKQGFTRLTSIERKCGLKAKTDKGMTSAVQGSLPTRSVTAYFKPLSEPPSEITHLG